MLGALAFTFGIHVVANATARFLVPLLPLLVLYVGPALTGDWRRASATRRALALGVALAFLLIAGSSWSAIRNVLP